jgi:hypothetical protein
MTNNTVSDRPFASIPNIHVDFEQGLLGIALDSKFSLNHFVYAYYNYKDVNTGKIYARIVRFTDIGNEGTNPKTILDKIPASSMGDHTGGALMFNKVDDKLYVTVGDALDDTSAQNLSSVNGKTLRLNRDGTIPNDNPFPNSPIYTYGHRNMFGIAFDERGHGILTEEGADFYDEINSLIKGGNYGWPTMQPTNTAADPLNNDSSIKPMRSYFITTNPTQATYYTGHKYPDLNGKFIVGSFRGNLYSYKISEDGTKLLEEMKIETLRYPLEEVVAIAASPTCDIYFASYNIYKLNSIDLSSSVDTMYPLQINATNVKISDVNYFGHTKDLSINLSDRHGLGDISIRIPKSMNSDIQKAIESHAQNNMSENNKAVSEFIYHLKIEPHDSYNVVKLQLPAGSPETLQVSINKANVVVTKSNK